MPTNEKPIFDFAPLKDFLKKRGYIIGTRSAYEPFTPEDVKAADITNGSMSFTDDGIFVKGNDGLERQVFLYKKDYRLQQYGKPRYHICKCETIDEFISIGRFKQHYVRANSEPVPVIDLDDGRALKNITDLPLCRNCAKKIIGYGEMNSNEFVEMLKRVHESQGNDSSDLNLDIFGYTEDWEEISKKYRESHHYTCENCGLKIEDEYEQQYIHVHHKDGNKVNNMKSNLQCLCLYCHAHVNEHHMKRLINTEAKKIIYEEFIKKYRK